MAHLIVLTNSETNEDMLFNLEQLSVPIEKLKDRVEFTRKMYGKWNY